MSTNRIAFAQSPDPYDVVDDALDGPLNRHLFRATPDETQERAFHLAQAIRDLDDRLGTVPSGADDPHLRDVLADVPSPVVDAILEPLKIMSPAEIAHRVMNLAKVGADIGALYSDTEKLLGHIALAHRAGHALKIDGQAEAPDPDELEAFHTRLHQQTGRFRH